MELYYMHFFRVCTIFQSARNYESHQVLKAPFQGLASPWKSVKKGRKKDQKKEKKKKKEKRIWCSTLKSLKIEIVMHAPWYGVLKILWCKWPKSAMLLVNVTACLPTVPEYDATFFSFPDWSHRKCKELPGPQVFQAIHGQLLLWGGAESEDCCVRPWQHDAFAWWWRLPGTDWVHLGRGDGWRVCLCVCVLCVCVFVCVCVCVCVVVCMHMKVLH